MRSLAFEDIAQRTAKAHSRVGRSLAQQGLPVIVQEVKSLQSRVDTLERVCEAQLRQLAKADAKALADAEATEQERVAKEAAERKRQLAEVAAAAAEEAVEAAAEAAKEAGLKPAAKKKRGKS